MKKIVLVLAVFVLFTAGLAEAVPPWYEGGVDNHNWNWNRNDNVNQNVNTNTNTNTNTNVNVNEQAQEQNQSQGQSQGQAQANKQEINFNTPGRILTGFAPQVYAPSELGFVQGGTREVSWLLPGFGAGNVIPLRIKDTITEVLFAKEGIKFHKLYAEVLKALTCDKVIMAPVDFRRYQIIEVDSVKSWTTGGNMNMNGVNNAGTGTMGGGGGIFPSVGRSKASPLYTVIIVRIK